MIILSKNKGIPAILFLLALTLQPILAQELSVSAPSVVSVNKAFNLTITSGEQGDIEFPAIDGMRVLSGPNTMVSHQSSYVNGRLSNTAQVTNSYVVMFEKEGLFEVPPFILKSGRKELKSAAFKITVQAGTATQQASGQGQGQAVTGGTETILLRQNASKKEVYQGEQFTVDLKILVRERLQITGLNPPSYDGFWNQELEGDQTAQNEEYDGLDYTSQVIKRNLLLATKAGDISIEPNEMDVVVQKRVQRPRSRNPFGDIFDDPFFDSPFESYQNVSRHIRSNALTIKVNPLPAGAPASFRGAVGSYSVKVALSRDSLPVNDALNLKITFTGKGNLAMLELPEVDFPGDLEVFEPKTVQNIKHTVQGSEGSVSFEYIIIPRKAGPYRIAPVNISWFDPQARAYRQYNAGELVFVAKASDNEVHLTDRSGAPGVYSSEVKDIGSDILYIKLKPGKWYNKKGWMVASALNLYFLAVLLVVFMAFLFIGRREQEERDPASRRQKKAKAMAAKRLKTAQSYLNTNNDLFYEEVLKAYWGYFSDKLGIPTLGLSRENLNKAFETAKMPEAVVQQIWEVIEECELSRYGNTSPADRNQLYEKAVECLTKTIASV